MQFSPEAGQNKEVEAGGKSAGKCLHSPRGVELLNVSSVIGLAKHLLVSLSNFYACFFFKSSPLCCMFEGVSIKKRENTVCANINVMSMTPAAALTFTGAAGTGSCCHEACVTARGLCYVPFRSTPGANVLYTTPLRSVFGRRCRVGSSDYELITSRSQYTRGT